MRGFTSRTLALFGVVAVAAAVLAAGAGLTPKECTAAAFTAAYADCLKSEKNSPERATCVDHLNEQAVYCVSKQVGTKNSFEEGLSYAVDFLARPNSEDSIMNFMSNYIIFN